MSDLVECRVKLKEEELILNLKEEEKEEKFKQNPKVSESLDLKSLTCSGAKR